MTFIIIILIILLIISIANNYMMYQKKIHITQCPKTIINNINLPDNTEYKNITFFYKKNAYNKCYKDDLKNNIISENEKRYQGDMILMETLNNLKKKYIDKLYFIVNDDNSSIINLSDENILGIKYLPDK
jgi:hypothetical protein